MFLNSHIYISGLLGTMSGISSNLVPQYSQLHSLGSELHNWRDIFAISGTYDSGIFPLFSTNGTIGNPQRIWKEVHAESGFFNKEFFFKGLSAHVANVYCGHNGNATLIINNTKQVIPITTDVIIDFGYNRSSNTIIITSSGLYKITGECSVEVINTAGGVRGKLKLALQRDGIDINGAQCLADLEETSSLGACNLRISWIDGLVPNNQIRMVIQDLAGTEPNEQIPSGSARLLIERIR